MKILDSDIVEVLNLSNEQLGSIRGQQCDFNIKASDIIGQRFRVKVVVIDNKYSKGRDVYYQLVGWNWGGHFNGWFDPAQLRIVRSPIKNKIVRFFS